MEHKNEEENPVHTEITPKNNEEIEKEKNEEIEQLEEMKNEKDMDGNVCEEHNENMDPQFLERKEMSPITNMKKNSNIFAENIAKEAKMKASEIISKNERIQQEFSGVGTNTNYQNSYENNYIDINEEYICINDSEDDNENHDDLIEHNPKKKILVGARAVMPTNDKELLEKLKQRRI